MKTYILSFFMLLTFASYSQVEIGGIAGISIGKDDGLTLLGVTAGGEIFNRFSWEIDGIYSARAIQPSILLKVNPFKIINVGIGYYTVARFSSSATQETSLLPSSGLLLGLEADFKSNLRLGLRGMLPNLEANKPITSVQTTYYMQLFIGYTFRKK